MVKKILLYKYEYKNLEENTIPKFTPEDIGHVLYTIEKGISSKREYGVFAIFEENPLETKKFPVNFRNINNSTRLDITISYKTVKIERDFDSNEAKGYTIISDVEKVDITSFFTNIKNSISEHKIYEIGGGGFRDEIRGKPLEEKKAILEGITHSKEFKSFDPSKQMFYLNILREIYRKLDLENLYWKIQRKYEKAVSKQIASRKFVKGELNVDENPFKVDLKKFEFLKKEQMQTQRTKSLVYKREYAKDAKIPELTVEVIGNILIEANMIPHSLDYEEEKHHVNFRNVKDGTRKDLTFHYAHIVPIFGDAVDSRGVLQPIGQNITGRVTKVDNVSFFTNEKNGVYEHRIYQIGARYEAKELTIDDLFGLGDLNHEIEDYDRAIKFYNKVLELEPENTDAISNSGLAYLCKGDDEKAFSLLHKALKIDPEDSLTWDCLGIAYEHVNEFKKAKEAYQKGLGLDPSDEYIQQHLTEINEKIDKKVKDENYGNGL